jgi:CSLREA domain-containing protein
MFNRILHFTILSCLLAGLFASQPPTPVRAAGIVVTTNADAIANDGFCSLREAILNATFDNQSGSTDCAAGSGADTISFAGNYTITLAGSQLPGVTSNINIMGNGSANTIIQAHASPNSANHRIFSVWTGASLTLHGVTLQHGHCNGSCDDIDVTDAESVGGAIGVTNGALSVHDSVITNNTSNGFGGGILVFGAGSVLTMTGTTISNNSSQYGGGLYSDNGTVTITNTSFSNNSASGDIVSSGGGIWKKWGTINLTDTNFAENSAVFGGGMYLSNLSATLNNLTLQANMATVGAGLAAYTSTGSLTNAVFDANTASNTGGGIYLSSGAFTINNVTFKNNAANQGAGMYNNQTSPELINVTFGNNTASSGGGGIYNFDSSPVIKNATFNENSSSSGGKAINNVNNSNPVVTNSILWGSSFSIINNSSSTPTISYSIVQGSGGSGAWASYLGTDGGNNLDTDPLLGPLADHGGFTQTMAPALGSPAVDWSADAGSCPSHDQRGVPRPQGWGCDMGAFERYFKVLSITRNDPSPTAASQVVFTVTFSQVAHDVDPSDFKLTTTGVTEAEVTNVSNLDDSNFEVTVDTGTGNGTIRLDLINDGSISNDWGQYLGIGITSGEFTSGETYEIQKSKTFASAGLQDGWILESSEKSNKGGKLNKGGSTINLGDDAAKKQYRAILSFDTSTLPADAVITKVTLRVKRQGVTGGGNPINTFKGLFVDIKKGSFGTTGLQLGDFKAKADQSYGTFKPALTNGWYAINLTGAINYINYDGVTQLRLRFKLDDNNNLKANFLKLYSGNAAVESRPQLVVEYYIPYIP